MTSSNGPRERQLLELLNLLCEGQATPSHVAQLEQIVRADRDALKTYLDYIDLHGALHWDAAQAGVTETASSPTIAARVISPAVTTVQHSSSTRTSARIAVVVASVCLLAVIGTITLKRTETPAVIQIGRNEPIPTPWPAIDQRTQQDDSFTEVRPAPLPSVSVKLNALDNRHQTAGQDDTTVADRGQPLPSLDDPRFAERTGDNNRVADRGKPSSSLDDFTRVPAEPADLPQSADVATVVAFTNVEIQAAWDAAGIMPSAVANDEEWIRRVYLDIVGHVPPVEQVVAFTRDKSSGKRTRLVDTLLDDLDYVRHWSTVWTNELVGRSTRNLVERESLEKFLRDAFAANRGWDAIVTDLVAAEGRLEDNGASGFLLAHLNNQAVPATAITSRIFLGIQVQCTQCHPHPFNDWTQNQFWELNSFFKQTASSRRPQMSGNIARKLTDSPELVTRLVGGPTHYETRSGLMQVAFPRFETVSISPDPHVNRRLELARLMTTGPHPQAARAIVNRMWKHFMGVGFTTPVDDMGPHNPPTHPQLLDGLTEAFVRVGYDLKHLVRWICNSEAYGLSSRLVHSNTIDDPESGNSPLFSHVYVKPMTAEQVYDSLLVATRADRSPGFDWGQARSDRNQWIQQFLFEYQTEENDESSTFEGTVSQALMMMNGDLIDSALRGDRNTWLRSVATGNDSDMDQINKLALAALSRKATPQEASAFRGILRQARSGAGRQPIAVALTLQDIFWAYLNSSEFILVH